MRFFALGLWLAAGCMGCARDVVVELPNAPADAGSIDIVFTRAAKDVTVTVDGQLVAKRRHTRYVHIGGVPPGMADVIVAAGSGAGRVERAVRIAVGEGRTTTIPLAAPAGSAWGGVGMSFIGLAMAVAFKVITASLVL
jgi:hypothetical protein